MGYQINFTNANEIKLEVYKQTNMWLGELSAIGESLAVFNGNMGMNGKAADSIENYLVDIHYTLIASLQQMIEEYTAKFLVYEGEYYQIDESVEAMLTQDTFDQIQLDIILKRDEFQEVSLQIQSVIGSVDDICQLYYPEEYPVLETLEIMEGNIILLRTDVAEYEENHKNDCESIRAYLNEIQGFIHGQNSNYNGKMNVSTKQGMDGHGAYQNHEKIKDAANIASYDKGTIAKEAEYSKLVQLYGASESYCDQNKITIDAGYDKLNKELQEEMADARASAGAVTVIFGLLSVVVGTVAIVASFGAATPLVAAVVFTAGASSTAYGVAEITEGEQEIAYGLAGDTTSISFNPIRDTVFAGNQKAYDCWGVANEIIASGGTTLVKTAATTGTKVVMKQLSKEVGKDALVEITIGGVGKLGQTLDWNPKLTTGFMLATGAGTAKSLGRLDSAIPSSKTIGNALTNTDKVSQALDNVKGNQLQGVNPILKNGSPYSNLELEHPRENIKVTKSKDGDTYQQQEIECINKFDPINNKYSIKQLGNYGEIKANHTMVASQPKPFPENIKAQRLGNQQRYPHTLDEKTVRGIDGIYLNVGTPPPKYIIDEVKYNTAKLSKKSGQMTDTWLTKKNFKDGKNRIYDFVDGKNNKDLYDDIIDSLESNDGVMKTLTHVEPDGTVNRNILGGKAEILNKVWGE